MVNAALILALLLYAVPANAQPRAVNAVARDLTQIAADLERMVSANSGTPLSDKVEDSLAKVNSAIGKLRQSPPDNLGGVGDLEGAVGDLEAAVKDKLLRVSAGNQLLNRMANVARQIAVRAISQGATTRRNSARNAEAEKALAVGDSERRAGRYKEAVAGYRDALSKAVTASAAAFRSPRQFF